MMALIPWALAAMTAAMVVSCGDDRPPPGPKTFAVDCVAVLGLIGAAPATQPIPLSEIPYSGAPRDKRIDELDDNSLGRFCDFEQCVIKNGYDRTCYVLSPNARGISGAFSMESEAILSSGMETCYPSKDGDPIASLMSREECVSFFRSVIGDCHVGLHEDCMRENVSGAFGPNYGPSCYENCGPGRRP